MMGYQMDDLEMRVEIAKNRIKISDLHLGDTSGEFSIKQLKCVYGGSWVFEAPLIQIRDFQPSRLRSLQSAAKNPAPLWSPILV